MRIKHLFVVIHIGIKGEVDVAKHVKVRLASLNMFKPYCDILLTIPRRYFFCGSFLLFIFTFVFIIPLVCSLQPCDHLL